MKAVVYTRFNQPLAIESVADPSPQDHGVVIGVKATGLCRSDWRVFPVLLCFNLWGSVTTVSDYRIFQQTYAEIYKLASETEGRLEIHFPGKPLEDPKRNLSIGNYPDSELRIDVVNGGLL